MLEAQTRDIGKHTYTVTPLDAIKGRRAFVRLANAAAPVLSRASSPEDLVGTLLSALSEKDVDHFCDLFGLTSTVTGGDYGERTPLLTNNTFMNHFAGNYLDLLEWLAFCVEVNFGSFFTGIGALVDRIKPALVVPAKTTAT